MSEIEHLKGKINKTKMMIKGIKENPLSLLLEKASKEEIIQELEEYIVLLKNNIKKLESEKEKTEERIKNLSK